MQSTAGIDLSTLGTVLGAALVAIVVIGRVIEKLLPAESRKALEELLEAQKEALDLKRRNLELDVEMVHILREIHSDRKADLVRQESFRATIERMSNELTDHIRDEAPVLASLAKRGAANG